MKNEQGVANILGKKMYEQRAGEKEAQYFLKEEIFDQIADDIFKSDRKLSVAIERLNEHQRREIALLVVEKYGEDLIKNLNNFRNRESSREKVLDSLHEIEKTVVEFIREYISKNKLQEE